MLWGLRHLKHRLLAPLGPPAGRTLCDGISLALQLTLQLTHKLRQCATETGSVPVLSPTPPPPHRRNTHRSRAHPPSHGALEPRRRARGRILARLFFRAAFQFPPAAMKQPLEARSSSLTPREYACCGCATLLSPETPPFCDHGTCSNCGPRREFVDDCRPLRDI